MYRMPEPCGATPHLAAGKGRRTPSRQCLPAGRPAPARPPSDTFDCRQGRPLDLAAILAPHHGARPRCEGHRTGAGHLPDPRRNPKTAEIHAESTRPTTTYSSSTPVPAVSTARPENPPKETWHDLIEQ